VISKDKTTKEMVGHCIMIKRFGEKLGIPRAGKKKSLIAKVDEIQKRQR